MPADNGALTLSLYIFILSHSFAAKSLSFFFILSLSLFHSLLFFLPLLFISLSLFHSSVRSFTSLPPSLPFALALSHSSPAALLAFIRTPPYFILAFLLLSSSTPLFLPLYLSFSFSQSLFSKHLSEIHSNTSILNTETSERLERVLSPFYALHIHPDPRMKVGNKASLQRCGQ